MSAATRKMRKMAKGSLVSHNRANLAPQPSGAGTDAPSAILLDINNKCEVVGWIWFSCNKKIAYFRHTITLHLNTEREDTV